MGSWAEAGKDAECEDGEGGMLWGERNHIQHTQWNRLSVFHLMCFMAPGGF